MDIIKLPTFATRQEGSVSLVAAAAVLGGVLAWGFSTRRSERSPTAPLHVPHTVH